MERGMAAGGNLRSLARIAILLLCIGAGVALVTILTADRFDGSSTARRSRAQSSSLSSASRSAPAPTWSPASQVSPRLGT